MASKGVKLFNFIRQNSSEAFINVVPSATEDNITEVKNVLFNDAYQPMLNEFQSNLINRIVLTIVRNKSYSNPLALFKKGSQPLGTDIQEIYTNPSEAEQYEYSNTAMAKLLTITDPDTHVAYYRRNRQDLYTKTISREGLQGAFASWDKFEDFVSSITQSLYSGNYIDEFKYTKGLIEGAYENNKAIIKVVDEPVDEATGKKFVKVCRSLYNKMSFPSTEYNAYSKFSGAKGTITTWTDKDRIVVILGADTLANVDVDVLASAFNMNKADFMGRVIAVDNFNNPNILGVICDEAWLQIYDNIFRFDEFYNARVMAWNEYLHAWSTYAISPFANAVILAKSEPVPATKVDIGANDIDLSLSTQPTGETLEITIEPENATTNVNYMTSDEAVFTVEKISNKEVKVTPVSVGNATLTAKSDNGLSSSANVKVEA